MKKLLTLLLTLALLLSLSTGALAAGYSATVNPESVLLVDADSGARLYEHNADARVYPASTTKILTALVVLEHVPDPSAIVTVDGSVLAGIHEGDDSTLEPMLQAGEQITVRDLLYGLLIVSGNDTAAVLANYVSGSVAAFAELMNEKAAALGMADSHFTNPHGVQDENHYTTASDMARLCSAALDDAEFMRIVGTADYTIPATNLAAARELHTSNYLLAPAGSLPGTAYAPATGIKTGYTPTAGGCLVSSAEENGVRLLCLIYGDRSAGQQERWGLARDLLEFGFAQYETQELASLTEPDSTEAAANAPQTDAAPDEAPQPTQETRHGGARWLWILLSILLGLLLLGSVSLALLREANIRQYIRRVQRRGGRVNRAKIRRGPTILLALAALVSLVLLILCAGRARSARGSLPDAAPQSAASDPASPSGTDPTPESSGQPAPQEPFHPAATAASDPAVLGVQWQVYRADAPVDFVRQEEIHFGTAEEYFALEGVAGFRSDNWRSGATYGTADVEAQTISNLWEIETGSLAASGGGSSWTGSGWTGQPILVQWDDTTRGNMNLYADKKTKSGLVEVIYATLDGHIYFLDLEDGSYTRDPINLGMCFKGAGAVDPRGWPLLYVGSGDETIDGKRPRMYIISLIDGSVLYESGDRETLSLRHDHSDWCAFDSSPLVDAETDTLIWPGENGILYTIRLNARYDADAGTVSVAPGNIIKARYDTARSGQDAYWYGMECSPVVVDHYLYASENGGMFFCVDLNTMELVWAQDTKDDSNSTPVYEPDGDDHGYLYTAPSLHWTADTNACGSVPIYKLDAVTGEIVWARSYHCGTVEGVSGGVQSTPLLGRTGTSLEGLVIYSISRTPDMYTGILVALDTSNGSEVWRMSMDHYTWSSPAAVYGADGRGYVVLCDSAGTVFLLDGASGTVLDSASVGSLVEASPAVFGDTVVVGTRGQRICALKVN